MTATVVLKEWPVSLWVLLRDGLPFDYSFGRATAFAAAKRRRALEPDHFWSVAPFVGTVSVKVPAK